MQSGNMDQNLKIKIAEAKCAQVSLLSCETAGNLVGCSCDGSTHILWSALSAELRYATECPM
jgi:hypothetical protein